LDSKASEPAVRPDERLIVPGAVRSRALDDGLVVLDLRTVEYFNLDPVGTLAWKGFAAGRSAEEVALEVAAAFQVSVEEALGDLLELAGELVARGLLVRTGERGNPA
jgi:hypothetical protein